MPAVAAPDLLEREADLAVLDAALARAQQGSGTVVLVSGEAGIGKSTLLAGWVSGLARADVRVLTGWCDDFLTGRPLGPLRDVARSVGGALADAVASTDTGAVLDAVLALLDDPLRPVVLALEDLHWADEATLDVVRYVGRRITDLPGVLVLTFRDEVGADHPLTGVLGALASAPVARISPAPLSEVAVAALLGDGPRDAAEVVAVTGGNPFFVSEVARTRGEQVPSTVADSVLARVRALTDAPRHALHLLSVMPGAVPRDLAAEVVGDVTLLAPAERRGLLAVSVDTVRFRHELARRAVVGALAATEAMLAHRRVLEVLLARDHPDVAVVLHHAIGAGAHDVVALRGPEAADEAYRAGAYREVAALSSQVLAHADRLAPEAHARLLVQRAWSLYNLHRFDEACEAADAAVRVREGLDDPAPLVEALLTRARMEYIANHPERARATLAHATELAAPVDDPDLRAEVLGANLAMLVLGDRVDEATALTDEALQAAVAVGRRDLEVLARNYRGLLRIARGQEDLGLQELRTAVDLGRTTGVLEATARAYTSLVEELARSARWDVARTTIDEAVAYYDDHDFVAHRYNSVAHLGLIELYTGNWDAAEAIFDAVHASADQAGVLEVLALNGLARLATRRGDPDAEGLIERAWQVALDSEAAQYITTMGAARVEWAWLNQRPELVPETVARALLPTAPPQHRAMLLRQAQLSGVELDVVIDPDEHPEPLRAALRGDWRGAADAMARVGATYSRALELASSGEVEPMLEALQVLDGLGAAPAARWVRTRLRAAGVRSLPRGPQAATRSHPAGLTPRQVEVLALVAEGLTNAEIADRLVLSTRTVDHHVSAILDKLGVDTRQEAAATVVDG